MMIKVRMRLWGRIWRCIRAVQGVCLAREEIHVHVCT